MKRSSVVGAALMWAAALGLAGPAAAGAPPEVHDIVEPVTPRDHVRGPRDAPVKLIESGDTECPQCKRFHPTLKRIVEDYRGQVAWVFRHLPIAEIHPRAPEEAEATALPTRSPLHRSASYRRPCRPHPPHANRRRGTCHEPRTSPGIRLP
jgi:thiol-disulfide isomerase/thioredoxin